MPTYLQARFIARAINSVQSQTLEDWELIIVDDGSPDDTADVVAAALADPRIAYHHLPRNGGVGAALNQAMERAHGRLIAYLPSDDVYYPEHLASLAAILQSGDGAVLAYSGVRHHHRRTVPGQIEGEPLQLVQVMHRVTEERWTERRELVSDDLDVLFWSKLRPHGAFAGSGAVSCEWADHPEQSHKIIREPMGGINPYRARFGVREPMRFQSSVGNMIDEVERYRAFRERPDTPPARDSLNIVLTGELAYNAERVLALEERGHRLFGLWMPEPQWFNTVGPVPFGHVEDLPRRGWREALRALPSAMIYALLNWQAVPFAAEVLRANPGIPFVWHFKEGPTVALEKGFWPDLVELMTRA
ncbi:MAG TPA: glycosyltransferase family A protein, partial [Dehalococcoidia bacterium]